ncbi:hypothetical protein EHN07_05205 [Buttiauxella warmboldiae]|uniref:Uncharacterized protein n=1 Tax=Buttiauxella warmboldiae TaxID=82993 RepID=A0A3N5DPU3_9ENTR|nr:ExeA family protein [Buttiauxella warmboldiae]RPH29607.1 hypothetical protein EHN07_05205 [Buttiauxella warmboldiae]
MYRSWFGLNNYLFKQDAHLSSLACRYHEYAASVTARLHHNGIVWIYGEPGVGKSELLKICHYAVENSVRIVASPTFSPDDFTLLLVGYPASVNDIAATLLTRSSPAAHAVMMIDNAHLLPVRTIYWLLALQAAIHQQSGTLSLLLCSHSAASEIAEIDRQIIYRWRMPALTRSQCRQGILKAAADCGAQSPIFTRAALNRIWRAGAGKPAHISLLTECALMSAMLRKKKRVSWWDSLRAECDLNGTTVFPALRRGILLLIMMLASVVAWQYIPQLLTRYPQLTLVKQRNQLKPDDAAAKLRAVLDNEAAGMAQYFAIWGYQLSPKLASCDTFNQTSLMCVQVKSDINTLANSGLPWMATLSIGARVGYVSVVRVGKEDVDLLTGGQTWTVTRDWLAKHWQGEALQFRLMPPSSGKSVSNSSPSEDKAWLTQILNKTSIMPPPQNLTYAIRAFQQSAGLKADGVAGEKTLITLAQRVGDAPILATDKQE